MLFLSISCIREVKENSEIKAKTADLIVVGMGSDLFGHYRNKILFDLM